MCRNDSLVEGVGTAESSEVRLADIAVHVSHENNGIASSLPGGKGGREISEEGIMGAGGVPKGFQVAMLLGVNCLEAGFLRYIGAVATNNVDTAACAALEAEPRPAAPTRGVHTRSSDVGCDWTRTKEEHATILLLVEVVMDVVAGNSA